MGRFFDVDLNGPLSACGIYLPQGQPIAGRFLFVAVLAHLRLVVHHSYSRCRLPALIHLFLRFVHLLQLPPRLTTLCPVAGTPSRDLKQGPSRRYVVAGFFIFAQHTVRRWPSHAARADRTGPPMNLPCSAKMSDNELSRLTGRPQGSITRKRQELGIPVFCRMVDTT